MKKSKKALCTALAVLTISASTALPRAINPEKYVSRPGIVQMIDAEAASPVVTGGFNGDNWSGYTYVYANSYKSWGKVKYRNPKIKVCAFNANGKIKNGKFIVEITTPQDKNFKVRKSISGSDTFSLKYGYSTYRIRIIRNNSQITSKNRSKNRSNCYWWSIDAKSNCYF